MEATKGMAIDKSLEKIGFLIPIAIPPLMASSTLFESQRELRLVAEIDEIISDCEECSPKIQENIGKSKILLSNWGEFNKHRNSSVTLPNASKLMVAPPSDPITCVCAHTYRSSAQGGGPYPHRKHLYNRKHSHLPPASSLPIRRLLVQSPRHRSKRYETI